MTDPASTKETQHQETLSRKRYQGNVIKEYRTAHGPAHQERKALTTSIATRNRIMPPIPPPPAARRPLARIKLAWEVLIYR
ncbi:hypothetical protein ACUSIJ_01840 [Pseudochelatococcus sp. B33]